MRVFLKPGELYISDKPTIVSTILGSCIAVTIFNRRLKAGGICHAMLPRSSFTKGHHEFRYVDSSILYMLNKFETMGIRKDEMEIKLLGGADVIDRMNESMASIGQKNIEIALEVIRNENLQLKVSDIGGKLGRKVHFYTHTGKVLLKRINSVQSSLSA
ncbi:MAG: chemotaxis protein CheD [Proteobacteria bacterium]|nr:chemotaxis protein CheD [Pseudomonadota bacterium]